MAVEKAPVGRESVASAEGRMWRWIAVCTAVVITIFILACTAGYIVHPKQWMCTVVISGNNKCDPDGNLIH